jgi:hypothetical protein
MKQTTLTLPSLTSWLAEMLHVQRKVKFTQDMKEGNYYTVLHV